MNLTVGSREGQSSVPTATVATADLDADLRAAIVTAYYTARAVGDWAGELAALADATRYDSVHPGGELVVELCAGEAVGS